MANFEVRKIKVQRDNGPWRLSKVAIIEDFRFLSIQLTTFQNIRATTGDERHKLNMSLSSRPVVHFPYIWSFVSLMKTKMTMWPKKIETHC